MIALLRARKSVGPCCRWCESSAHEYEREYCIDHNASSDLLSSADRRRTTCRAGFHVTELAYRWQARRPGDPWPVAVAFTTEES